MRVGRILRNKKKTIWKRVKAGIMAREMLRGKCKNCGVRAEGGRGEGVKCNENTQPPTHYTALTLLTS